MSRTTIVIVQGMPCLGKSTLSEKLESELPDCRYLSMDSFKEFLWDKYGFRNKQEQKELLRKTCSLFYENLRQAVVEDECKYVLLDYVFDDRYWGELVSHLEPLNVNVKTLYMKPTSLEEHKVAWCRRSRDFGRRHPGHGASAYITGIGFNYSNNYESKINLNLPTLGNTLEIEVSFNPYSLSIDHNEILGFLQD